MKTILAAIALSLAALPALAETYRVTKVSDGDTITVVNTQNNQSDTVRLACIDAPESNQPEGRLSTVTLNAFVPVGSEVELNIVDTDRYERKVAEVFKNDVNVNLSMLKQGQAVVYHQYVSNCPDGNSYLKAEAAAKNQKLGFWNDPSFINPLDWRRGVRPTISKTRTRPRNVAPRSVSNRSRGYVAGSCKYLKSLGMSRFTPGDPNYTRGRDRDRDGVACE